MPLEWVQSGKRRSVAHVEWFHVEPPEAALKLLWALSLAKYSLFGYTPEMMPKIWPWYGLCASTKPYQSLTKGSSMGRLGFHEFEHEARYRADGGVTTFYI